MPTILEKARHYARQFNPANGKQSKAIAKKNDVSFLEELQSLLGEDVAPIDPDIIGCGDIIEEWDNIHPADLQRLLNPPDSLPACSWCGGQNIHNRSCFTLHSDGPCLMRWGKHRGKPVATLPRDYLQWLQDSTAHDLKPELRREIIRTLHAGKHDYQPMQLK